MGNSFCAPAVALLPSSSRRQRRQRPSESAQSEAIRLTSAVVRRPLLALMDDPTQTSCRPRAVFTSSGPGDADWVAEVNALTVNGRTGLADRFRLLSAAQWVPVASAPPDSFFDPLFGGPADFAAAVAAANPDVSADAPHYITASAAAAGLVLG